MKSGIRLPAGLAEVSGGILGLVENTDVLLALEKAQAVTRPQGESVDRRPHLLRAVRAVAKAHDIGFARHLERDTAAKGKVGHQRRSDDRGPAEPRLQMSVLQRLLPALRVPADTNRG